MEDLSPSDLKSILHSKRANLYYLQHCRVLVNDGRVEYVTEEGNQSLYWNIPIANTTSILLGTGTSITQAAMREMAKAGVLVGFCGGGGTPLFAAMELENIENSGTGVDEIQGTSTQEIAWLTPQSEYRPTEYLQHWVSFWFKEDKRLAAAKVFQLIRLQQIRQHWLGNHLKREDAFAITEAKLLPVLDAFQANLDACATSNDVLAQEAVMTKALYKIAANASRYGDFVRAKRGTGSDMANRFLDHGNYLAYGLGATAAWVLGLPHGLAVLHGKTRRGGLVFDIADIIKDALILPQAFIAAMAGESEQEFRQRVITSFNRAQALDVMIDAVKDTALRCSEVGK